MADSVGSGGLGGEILLELLKLIWTLYSIYRWIRSHRPA
jgi:hypothetical protein